MSNLVANATAAHAPDIPAPSGMLHSMPPTPTPTATATGTGTGKAAEAGHGSVAMETVMAAATREDAERAPLVPEAVPRAARRRQRDGTNRAEEATAAAAAEKPVSDEGLTPAMRALVASNPEKPIDLPELEVAVGSRIELCNLVGTEKGWNGQRGTVMEKHVSVHPANKNIRVWVMEISFDSPSVTKTVFFSDKVRLTSKEPKSTEKKSKPNAPCPCGSGKKYKKCCGAS